jgi:hypothetical protein
VFISILKRILAVFGLLGIGCQHVSEDQPHNFTTPATGRRGSGHRLSYIWVAASSVSPLLDARTSFLGKFAAQGIGTCMFTFALLINI